VLWSKKLHIASAVKTDSIADDLGEKVGPRSRIVQYAPHVKLDNDVTKRSETIVTVRKLSEFKPLMPHRKDPYNEPPNEMVKCLWGIGEVVARV